MRVSIEGAFASNEVQHSLDEILNKNDLLVMATSAPDGQPHINTAFFAQDQSLLYFLSDPQSAHIRNIRADNRVAISIQRSTQIWGDKLLGARFWGTVSSPESRARALQAYAKRHPAFDVYIREDLAGDPAGIPAEFFAIRVARFCLFDEARFGEETYVRGAVTHE